MRRHDIIPRFYSLLQQVCCRRITVAGLPLKTYSRLLRVQRSKTVDTTCRIKGGTRFFDIQRRGIWNTRMVDTQQHVGSARRPVHPQVDL